MPLLHDTIDTHKYEANSVVKRASYSKNIKKKGVMLPSNGTHLTISPKNSIAGTSHTHNHNFVALPNSNRYNIIKENIPEEMNKINELDVDKTSKVGCKNTPINYTQPDSLNSTPLCPQLGSIEELPVVEMTTKVTSIYSSVTNHLAITKNGKSKPTTIQYFQPKASNGQPTQPNTTPCPTKNTNLPANCSNKPEQYSNILSGAPLAGLPFNPELLHRGPTNNFNTPEPFLSSKYS